MDEFQDNMFDNLSSECSSPDTADSSEQVALGDSEDQVSSSEEERTETSERDVESTSDGFRGETSSEVVVPYDTLKSIDSNLNSFLGLFVVCLVLFGCGLILHFIWKLLNK